MLAAPGSSAPDTSSAAVPPGSTATAESAGSSAEIKFVNIREAAGWSAEGVQATPKIAALLAAAALPEPDPVPSVEYKSAGQVLVIGPARAAVFWAKKLNDNDKLNVSVLITGQDGGELSCCRNLASASASVSRRGPGN